MIDPKLQQSEAATGQTAQDTLESTMAKEAAYSSEMLLETRQANLRYKLEDLVRRYPLSDSRPQLFQDTLDEYTAVWSQLDQVLTGGNDAHEPEYYCGDGAPNKPLMAPEPTKSVRGRQKINNEPPVSERESSCHFNQTHRTNANTLMENFQGGRDPEHEALEFAHPAEWSAFGEGLWAQARAAAAAAAGTRDVVCLKDTVIQESSQQMIDTATEAFPNYLTWISNQVNLAAVDAAFI